MKIKIGCDIVEIKRLKEIDRKVLYKIFHKTELKNKIETLAGFFAAKESCKKVFNDLDWHDIEIKRQRNGKPFLIINKKNIVDYDLSISHNGEYAMAVAIFLLKC